MAETRSKRQRLSTDTYKERGGDSGDNENDLPVPTTPSRRASYLSPTKASLARSHPNILAKSPKRGSLTEPRGKLLRQELLGSRTNSNEVASIPKTAPRLSRPTTSQRSQAVVQELSEKDGFAQAIAQSFPPLDVDRHSESKQTRTTLRPPLRTRQAPNIEPGKNLRSDKAQTPALDDIPIPKLVRKQDLPLPRQQSETRNEPELPPTPVQLGIGAAPDRPRGLASSSSMGSKSGSGRHRKRVRKEGGAITSSPLKRRNRSSLSPTDFSDVEEAEQVIAEEAAESDVEESITHGQNNAKEVDQNQDVDDVPPEVIGKQAELSKLRLELEKLRTDLASMEALADRLQRNNDLEMDDSVIELLNSESQTRIQSLQSPDTHPLFIQNPSTYLDLFAPTNLEFEHKTTTGTAQKRLKTLHNLTLKPSAPYAPDALHLSFNVQIDTEDSSIDKVILTRTHNMYRYGTLSIWMESRLQSPLHRLDIGGIIWGAGQYFEACVTRAKALRYLDKLYNKTSAPKDIAHPEDSLGTTDIPDLSRYLHQTQLLLSPPEAETAPGSKSPSPDSNHIQLLLSYEIRLTWTGDTTAHIDISLNGVNAKAQEGTKDLFARLLPSGVVEAVRGVGHVLGWGSAQQQKAWSNKHTRRGRK